jgi:hypothetical protein
MQALALLPPLFAGFARRNKRAGLLSLATASAATAGHSALDAPPDSAGEGGGESRRVAGRAGSLDSPPVLSPFPSPPGGAIVTLTESTHACWRRRPRENRKQASPPFSLVFGGGGGGARARAWERKKEKAKAGRTRARRDGTPPLRDTRGLPTPGDRSMALWDERIRLT